LQTGLKVLPIGIAEAGSWKYAYIYDLTSRHFQNLVDQARVISQPMARNRIMELYFLSVGFASLHGLQHVFGWSIDQIGEAINRLLQQKIVVEINEGSKPSGTGFILTSLKDE